MHKITKNNIKKQINEQWTDEYLKGTNSSEKFNTTLNVQTNKASHPLGFDVEVWEYEDADETNGQINKLFIKCPDLDVNAEFVKIAEGYLNVKLIIDKIADYIYNLK